ncbi:ATP-dependent helicase DinG [Halobacillus andaensis]|uniref:3'-5' exonuclease DinG n=1 Tax=Halobacillus andaensis TaxID=1176239 RepID=A0A917ET41_HALAA|nr:ATP-dependent DNA helicase DinG [Halobacillus andaensis]MBP2003296.1 ATP-dependent DNA helicase DinG [Halobacillus andaensis]GGF09599.1 ATP-dependent helicase DinG [Halobacillus andaensis]
MAAFAIVDLETTGNSSSKQDRIIEIGIVLIKEKKIVKEFSTLVYPEREIPPFISSLTGIDDEDVIGAPLFSEIAQEVYRLFNDVYIVAHNVEFDLGFLNAELKKCGLPALTNPIIDTVEMARILIPSSESFKLGQLAEQMNLGHDRPHRALSDAQVTGELLLCLLDRLKELPERTLTQLLTVTEKLKSQMRPFIEEAIDQARYSVKGIQHYTILHGIAVRKLTPGKKEKPAITEDFSGWLTHIFEGEKGLKGTIPSFETRAGQREMSESIYRALTEPQHALIEAGAGTGKSIAYLLSALYYSIKNNRRIVVSTYTTSLQNQLLHEEVPKLERLFDEPIRVELFKGKAHYISLAHFSYELENSHLDNYDEALAKAIILVWLTQTYTGDIEEIQLPSNGQQFWHKISAEQSVKHQKDENYFYAIAEEKAAFADVIITNHSLLSLDLISDQPQLPSYEKVIIDEAHQFTNVASRYFGVQLNYKELQSQLTHLNDLLSDRFLSNGSTTIKTKLEQSRGAVEQAKEELSQLSKFIYHSIKRNRPSSKTKSDIGRVQYTLLHSKDAAMISTASEMIERFLSKILLIKRSIRTISDQFIASPPTEPIAILVSRLEQYENVCLTIVEQLGKYFKEESLEEAKWVEIEGSGHQHSFYMFSEPVNLDELLRKKLLTSKQSIVFTSATLTTAQSFEFIRKTVGLKKEDKVIEKVIPSPYKFDQNARLMIPNDFPNVREDQEEFIYSVSEAIYSLSQVTKGRMLVLFTSYDMLKKTYYLLKEMINPEEYMIFGQGISSGSRDRLKKNFQAFDQSILLGTSSFWEGVDIPGDDLSCLMIVRLPFQPPGQPVQSIREQVIKKEGKNPFMDYSLPEAIIRFRQGFGRLIRSSTDRGIVFVCDQRIMEARYGKYFISSIPDIPVTYDSTTNLIKQAQKWL